MYLQLYAILTKTFIIQPTFDEQQRLYLSFIIGFVK